MSDNDDADSHGGDCDAITSPSETGGSSNDSISGKRKSRPRSVFRCWQFQLMIKADLRNGSNAVEKGKLLKEHLSDRTGHSMPKSVIGVVVFCDESQLLVLPDNHGLVTIELLGYVQANNTVPHSTMQTWLGCAAWKPVPGGLTSDNEYMSNMRRSDDSDDERTRLLVFGRIGANNVGRSAEKNARMVSWPACLLDIDLF
jgi:hypothetical protein